MKKSEAIRLFSSFMEGYYDEYYISDSDVEIFLDFLVNDLKMLPPSYIHYTDQDNGNTLCSERCEWEPENETK